MQNHTAAERGVVLVKFHPVDLGQFPATTHDESLMPGPQIAGEQFAMQMQIVNRYGAGPDMAIHDDRPLAQP